MPKIDNTKLKVAAQTAQTKMEEALSALQKYFVIIREEERMAMSKPKKDFPNVARHFVEVMKDYNEVAQFAGYDGAAVIEDLDNVAMLDNLLKLSDRLSQSIADSRLAWLAEAYDMTLLGYHAAKLKAKTNTQLKNDIEPTERHFAIKRTPKSEK